MRTFHIPLLAASVALLALTSASARADQLQMQNGDRYTGKIVSLTSNSIVLESAEIGTVTLPRSRVSAITFGTASATNAASITSHAPVANAASPSAPAANTDIAAAFRNLGGNTNFIGQVRQQMLTGADPAANQKYDELVSGLMSGQMSLSDLRNQARTSIDQINQLKRELGPQADESLDSYLTILQNFVNETEPAPTPPASAQAKPVQPAHSATNSLALPHE